jgi:hypothetical protein
MKRLLFCLAGLTMTIAPLSMADLDAPPMPIPTESPNRSIGEQLVEFIDRNNIAGRVPVRYQSVRAYSNVMEIISENARHHDTIVLNFDRTALQVANLNNLDTVQVTAIVPEYNKPSAVFYKESYLKPMDGHSVELLQLISNNGPMLYIDIRTLHGQPGISVKAPENFKVVQKSAVMYVRKQPDQAAHI